jgi:hypothetical protein
MCRVIFGVVLLLALPAASEGSGVTAVMPEQFGAKGDGQSDDTTAFQKAAETIQKAGDGVLILKPGAVYRVGRQTHAEGKTPYWKPEPVLRLENVRSFTLLGFGATLRLNDGLRYGAFDGTTGKPLPTKVSSQKMFIDYTAYVAACNLVHLRRVDRVLIENVTLDGNQSKLVLGGEWGDSGRQCHASGIVLDYVNDALLKDVVCREHALDGITILQGHPALGDPPFSPDGPPTPHRLVRVQCLRNGRQGVSWCGGRGLFCDDCEFSQTGRGAVSSGPGAGIDMESESGACRNARFTRCRFADNAGPGLICWEKQNIEDVICDGCVFEGTSSYSALVLSPRTLFRDCRFYGTYTGAHGNGDAQRATCFQNCLFADAIAEKLGQPARTFARLDGTLLYVAGENVTFDKCRFEAHGVRAAHLHGENDHERLIDCTFVCRHRPTDGVPVILYGTYLERCRFEDAGLKEASYIWHGKTHIGPGVTVKGPRLVWHPDKAGLLQEDKL